MVNEFVAFAGFGPEIGSFSPKTAAITTFALTEFGLATFAVTGFGLAGLANLSSLGSLRGGLPRADAPRSLDLTLGLARADAPRSPSSD